MNTENLVERILGNDIRSVARAITIAENDLEGRFDLHKQLYRHTGKAYIIGITGPPGAGKSTLTDQITSFVTSKGSKAAVIAVDPTSPFSGGALLGDRIRMEKLHGNSNLFFRSMATRGSLGGISDKTSDAVEILDAAGYDYIFIETVGVGQSELDIAGAADCTIVVLVPESGDTVQAMKAGLMEIGNVFAMNKSDRPGADNAFRALQSVLAMKNFTEDEWRTETVKTIASNGSGVPELMDKISLFKTGAEKSGVYLNSRKKRIKRRILQIVRKRILDEVLSPGDLDETNGILTKVFNKELSPYEYAEKLLNIYK